MPCKDLPDNTLWLAVTNPDGTRPHHFFCFNVIHAGSLGVMFFVHVYLCTNSKCCALVCLFDCLIQAQNKPAQTTPGSMYAVPPPLT